MKMVFTRVKYNPQTQIYTLEGTEYIDGTSCREHQMDISKEVIIKILDSLNVLRVSENQIDGIEDASY